MAGHNRTGGFSDEGGRDSDSDPFDRMRTNFGMGRGADMFSPGFGFSHGGTGDAHAWSMDDPMDGMDGMRSRQRPRPKFSSASTTMGPRPFQHERRASGGPPEPADPSHSRERIIHIQVEGDETDAAAAPQHPPTASARQQKPYARRDTLDTPVSQLQTEEVQRDARARSAPPDPEPQTAAARVPPLNVQRAAAAAQPHKPNYFNLSPKPFQSGQRPFQTLAFGQQGQIPIPVQVERGGAGRPPVTHHQQQQHHEQQQQQAPKPQQQQQQQQQQQPEEPKPQPPPPPPPKPKPKTPKERAMEAIASVRDRVAELGADVESFVGVKGEKEHLILDEFLTRELLKLDNVEANGDEEIRTTRRQVIMSIQKCLARLEAKVSPRAEGDVAKAEGEMAGGDAAMDVVESEAAKEGEVAGEGAAMETAQEADKEVEMKPATEETQPAMEVEPGRVAETQAADGTTAETAAAPDTPPFPAPAPTQENPPFPAPAPTQDNPPFPAPAPTQDNPGVSAPFPAPAPDPAPAGPASGDFPAPAPDPAPAGPASAPFPAPAPDPAPAGPASAPFPAPAPDPAPAPVLAHENTNHGATAPDQAAAPAGHTTGQS